MTSETRRILADVISDELSINSLIKQKEKTQSDVMVQVIEEQLFERQICPDCQNDMLYDEKEEEIYCPFGHYSHGT